MILQSNNNQALESIGIDIKHFVFQLHVREHFSISEQNIKYK